MFVFGIVGDDERNVYVVLRNALEKKIGTFQSIIAKLWLTKEKGFLGGIHW